MASKLLALAFSLALVPAALADYSVTLKDVHLCCDSCVKGVDKATAGIAGITAKADRDTETVTITAADKATAQKAVDSLVTAGYFGVSSDPSLKLNAMTGASDAKVQSLAVQGVHLCCKKCVTAVNNAIGKVDGVTSSLATKDAESFQVTGNFSPKAVFNALQEAGLTGKAGKAQ